MWILIAFLNPILHAWSNILDNYLTNKLFKNKTSLIFYASLLNFIFLPILFIFTGLPHFPNSHTMIIFLGIALINVLYLYPYYKALEENDTSNVVALFSLGQLFVPILAYFIVDEVLLSYQYIGIFIVLICSVVVSINQKINFKVNSSFWWMLACTFILSFETVLYKFLFESVNWITGFTWPIVFAFLFALIFLVFKNTRKNIIYDKNVFLSNIHIFGIEELTTFLGIAASTYAISIAPASIVKSITAAGPIFALIYAFLFRKKFPNLFKEKIDQRSIFKKMILFIILGFGLFLVLK